MKSIKKSENKEFFSILQRLFQTLSRANKNAKMNISYWRYNYVDIYSIKKMIDKKTS